MTALHCVRLLKPLAPLMQPVQRVAGQGAKRLAALATTIALQFVGVAVPNHVHSLAVRARRAACEAPLDKLGRCRLRIQRCQFSRYTLMLIGRQLP